MKDCTDCIRKNNPKYTKCYCAIYKEHPEKCNYKIRFKRPQPEQAEASSLSDLLAGINGLISQWETDEEDMHKIADDHNALMYKGRGTQLGICAEQLRNTIKTS